MDSDSAQKKTKEKSKNCKFIIIGDPNTRRQIEQITNPPSGGTNFLFWESKPTDEYPDGGWGLTLKQMPLREDGKKNSGQHIWKVTWFYDAKKNAFIAAKSSNSLVKNVEGKNAQDLIDIYNCYKKA